MGVEVLGPPYHAFFLSSYCLSFLASPPPSQPFLPSFLLSFILAAPRFLQDLSSPTGIEPGPSAVRARSPNHWTAREFSVSLRPLLEPLPTREPERASPIWAGCSD